MKLIVNADDCGYSKNSNKHIKEAIEKGKISSSTIMANMDETEEAASLYETFHSTTSFGIHLNLTEGIPLISSQRLVDFGVYTIKNDVISFCYENVERFKYTRLPKDVKEAIYKELAAQIIKLQHMGIRLSHIDSHQHIHTFPSLMGIIAQLQKDFDIHKIRRILNYVPNHTLSYWGRQTWYLISKVYNCHSVMTDVFSPFQVFFDNPTLHQFGNNESLELMVHPGHYQEIYQKEEQFMLNTEYPEKMTLINYRML